MTVRRLTLVAVLWCAWWLGAPATERHLPIADVKPGMTGVGRTVFAGTAIEDFTVEILGVLRNTIAPGRDLILARLAGGALAKTGVIAGMSGSPVYIDGRLVGAVSYQLGTFPTEPIAGITPIAEMIDAARAGGSRVAPTPAPVPLLADPAAVARFLRAARPVDAVGQVALPSAPGVRWPAGLDHHAVSSLRRIATPVTTAGLSPASASSFLGFLDDAGFVAAPAPGGIGGTAAVTTAPALRPGDPIGVTLASGDYTIGATGTVTDVVGQTVYAFGHPFFGLGPTRLPMTTAIVHAVLPSLTSSMKMASTGPAIGAFTQDRATVLAGRLGDRVETLPVSITLKTAEGEPRTITFNTAIDPFFTPLVVFVGIGNTLSTFERDLGVNTYAVRARLDLAGHPPLAIDDVFTGDGAATSASSAIAVPLAALIANDREPVRFERLTIDVTSTERPRATTIQRVWVDTPDIRPGRPVSVKILLRPYRGPDDVRTVHVQVPSWADGPLTLQVASGPTLAQAEARDGFTSAPPASLADLVAQLQRIRRNNRVYVRLYGRGAGAVVDGAQMPGLPNSVLAVLDGDRASGGTTTMTATPAGAWDVVLDTAVTGGRTLTLSPTVAPRRP